jgi:AmiR/NasT family two-component response regulator
MREHQHQLAAERNGTNVREAFTLLRRAARERNRRLSDLAGDIVAGSVRL